IDFTAGIAVNALGHADPTIAAIIHDQALKLIHVSNLYHASQAGELARLIVETTRLSGGMQKASKVFFANSGTEANEGAIKFCRKVGKLIGDVKKHKIVSFTNSFHGRTMGSLSATPNPKYQAPFAPMVPGFVVGEYNKAEGIAELVTEETCGVIVEPIQGEGGVYQGSAEFLGALRERCTQVSAVLVFDEIQCGLGRTGKLWAHQYLPKYIQPDVLTMAKSLANGFPIGAILVGEDVAEAIKIGDHGTTFGGNPLACRVAHHTFSRLSSTELLQSVQQSSDVITSRLRRLQYRFPSLITEIRGRGLLLGVQLSVDPTHFIDLCRERGLLIISAGNNTLRIIPPLNIEPEPLRNGLDIIEEAFSVM
ncbi:Acetylornithine aminotransferase, mitochondrial, partial [Neolecta irregularis DAH-3]